MMDNKMKMSIAGSLLLASSLGVGVGRLSATPPTRPVRLLSVSVEPAVSLTVLVDGKPTHIQCTDASGPVSKLNGKDFSDAKDLCVASTEFVAGAKVSVGRIADKISGGK